jgi:DnaJ-class molecular chaperone
MTLKTHPDKTDEPGAEEAFKKLAKAGFVLGDEVCHALVNSSHTNTHQHTPTYHNHIEHNCKSLPPPPPPPPSLYTC